MEDREVIVTRYAEALFGVASDAGLIDSMVDEVSKIAVLFEGETAEYFSSPLIPDERKTETLNNILLNIESSEDLKSFLRVLLRRGRIGLLSDIAFKYKEIVDEYHNIDTAYIYTPFELNEGDLLKISEKLNEKFSKKLRCNVVIDKSLYGGIVIKIGNIVYDMSLKSKIEILRQELNL